MTCNNKQILKYTVLMLFCSGFREIQPQQLIYPFYFYKTVLFLKKMQLNTAAVVGKHIIFKEQ